MVRERRIAPNASIFDVAGAVAQPFAAIGKTCISAGAGIVGGFFGNAVLGALFTSAPVLDVLYSPTLQSEEFLTVTPSRDVVYSVIGLVVLSAVHGVLFRQLSPSLPGDRWWKRGLAWGFTIWILYWVFQEWFVYHSLLREPLLLAGFELVLLLVGSLVEGVVIAALLDRKVHAQSVMALPEKS